MIRTAPLGMLVAVLAIGGWSALPANPDACKLISVNDATAVIGPPLSMTHTESNASFSSCQYSRPGQGPSAMPNHVEIHYWVMADVPTAQAKFQKVVRPGGPTPMAGTTITAVPKLGDEADIKRTPMMELNSIEFRRGVAIVTIGVSPLVDDSLLKAAAMKAMSRL